MLLSKAGIGETYSIKQVEGKEMIKTNILRETMNQKKNLIHGLFYIKLKLRSRSSFKKEKLYELRL